nr:MAG TPA: hypothetical protein [Caudoviricetes sp.]
MSFRSIFASVFLFSASAAFISEPPLQIALVFL